MYYFSMFHILALRPLHGAERRDEHVVIIHSYRIVMYRYQVAGITPSPHHTVFRLSDTLLSCHSTLYKALPGPPLQPPARR